MLTQSYVRSLDKFVLGLIFILTDLVAARLKSKFYDRLLHYIVVLVAIQTDVRVMYSSNTLVTFVSLTQRIVYSSSMGY